MVSRLFNILGRSFRILVSVAATIVVLFSFGWVIARPMIRADRLNADQVQITVLHWGEKNEDEILARLVSDFESLPENHDIRVLRTNLGQLAAVNTKLQTMFAAGDPTDVFYLSYEKVADFASKDLLADIDQLIENDQANDTPTIDLKDVFPAALEAYRYDKESGEVGRGRLIALPKDFTTVGFYYNKDLFEQAGLPEPSADGWTWDAFVHAARTIAKLPGCYGADFATWESMTRIFLWSHGVDFADPTWKVLKLDDPSMQAALDKLRGWFHDEERTLVSAKTQLETGQEPFLAGNVGMAGPFGRWKAPTYRLIENFDWDFAPFPHAAGHASVNGVFTTGWAIAEGSKHKSQSWRFIKYLSSPRAQELMCRAGLAIPILQSVANGPAFSDPSLKPSNFQVFLDAADHARPIIWPADPKYLHQLRVRLEDIFKLNKPVAPAMQHVERGWKDIQAADRSSGSFPRMPWGMVITYLALPVLLGIVIGLTLWWRRRPRGLAFQEEVAGYGMIGPWVVGFIAFTAFPIILSLLLAFTRWNGMTTLEHAEWTGLENLATLWGSDGTFKRSLLVTAWYALLAVPTSQVVALLAAMLMNYEFKSIGFFRATWYLPSVLAGVGMAVMWKWVFHHEHGLVRAWVDPLLPFGLTSPSWFEKDAGTWAVPAFVIVNLWAIGGTMMIYLAGLKGIPKDLYEAAEIDGAVGWQRFSNVTLPMLSPIVFFNVIIAVIASFQIFTQAYVMTGGGPGDATRFFVIYLYNQAFDFHDMGYASLLAWVLLLIILALTLLLMWASKKFVHYEALKS